jgi:hypothetical protein
MSEITSILSANEKGDPHAAEELRDEPTGSSRRDRNAQPPIVSARAGWDNVAQEGHQSYR